MTDSSGIFADRKHMTVRAVEPCAKHEQSFRYGSRIVLRSPDNRLNSLGNLFNRQVPTFMGLSQPVEGAARTESVGSNRLRDRTCVTAGRCCQGSLGKPIQFLNRRTMPAGIVRKKRNRRFSRCTVNYGKTSLGPIFRTWKCS